MVDVLSPQQRSFNMSRIRGKDTTPELVVRRLIHSLGYRFRLHVRNLPGQSDIVLPKCRAVIFVHGCFWHMHRCKYGKVVPATNVSFWAEKRRSNVERDRRNRAALRTDGWKVFEIWECHTREKEKLRAKLAALIQFLNHHRTLL